MLLSPFRRKKEREEKRERKERKKRRKGGRKEGRTSLVVQRLRVNDCNAGGAGSILVQGTKSPHAMQHSGERGHAHTEREERKMHVGLTTLL